MAARVISATSAPLPGPMDFSAWVEVWLGGTYGANLA
jgi:transglutaminase-like putative cysteine protease